MSGKSRRRLGWKLDAGIAVVVAALISGISLLLSSGEDRVPSAPATIHSSGNCPGVTVTGDRNRFDCGDSSPRTEARTELQGQSRRPAGRHSGGTDAGVLLGADEPGRPVRLARPRAHVTRGRRVGIGQDDDGQGTARRPGGRRWWLCSEATIPAGLVVTHKS